MKKYDHRSRTDMAALAREIRTSFPLTHPQFCAMVMANDIMRTNWLIMALAFISSWRVPKGVFYYNWFVQLKKRNPANISAAIESLADHVENGKDKSDPASAGGLNAAEVGALLMIMERCGWKMPIERELAL
jgi:hypothetical protein